MTKGQKEKKIKNEKGQKNKRTKGLRDKRTKGQKDKKTKGQRDKNSQKYLLSVVLHLRDGYVLVYMVTVDTVQCS